MTSTPARQFMEQLQAKKMTEAQLQTNVIETARHLGYPLLYHTYRSDGSAPGFPDLVMVSPRRRRVIFVELKRQNGRITPTQQEWIDGLTAAGQDARIWRPSDLLSGDVAACLKGAAA